ncbi:single-stranded DNA-binding protein [Paenibacillus larvae]|uniref:single-stranded DNA-binding protein n=1 Tax=Paenibacillus larvae TaxID=1464 RepID=UPI00227DD061|nr:single-stranded DNA-binding protein [Paenibacillus larvae]MCY9512400.1 single-stranded DNA-binding protein [Paenibacillus larvae]MCY9526979.1 single-stranded DNA-binding protein [Paenibacillus larvae]
MDIREWLKEREERRNSGGKGNDGLPEGVTRYVRLGSELKDGKKFALLANHNSWYYYFVHEDGDFATRTTFIKKHSCLRSPKEVGEDRKKYEYPDPESKVCLSCRAKARRVLYFMIPVYDFELSTWRILDVKEFHALNLIEDYDKLEKAAKKFAKDYTLVGDVVLIQKTSDGKSYSLTSAEIDETKLEEARKLVGTDEIKYAELANFRDEEDIRKILEEADDSKVDKSVLGVAEPDDVDPKF